MAQFQPITSHLFVLRCRRKPITPFRYRNKGDEISYSSSSVSRQTNRPLSASWKCCGTSRAAASSTTTSDSDREAVASESETDTSTVENSSNGDVLFEGKYHNEEGDANELQLDDYLVVGNGWKVRRMAEEEEEEIRKVAQIQAEAFHVPTLFFNDVFFQFFIAEVLSGLLYRLRNSPRDRYACLVAVPDTDDETVSKSQQEIVGVVDVTVLRDRDVVGLLDGAGEYLYVSGIAVSLNHRRKKVGTTLLKACEAMSVLWGYDNLVLRAYEDDWGARTLYANAGYTVVSGDPPWITVVGRKRRILMIKRPSS